MEIDSGWWLGIFAWHLGVQHCDAAFAAELMPHAKRFWATADPAHDTCVGSGKAATRQRKGLTPNDCAHLCDCILHSRRAHRAGHAAHRHFQPLRRLCSPCGARRRPSYGRLAGGARPSSRQLLHGPAAASAVATAAAAVPSQPGVGAGRAARRCVAAGACGRAPVAGLPVAAWQEERLEPLLHPGGRLLRPQPEAQARKLAPQNGSRVQQPLDRLRRRRHPRSSRLCGCAHHAGGCLLYTSRRG